MMRSLRRWCACCWSLLLLLLSRQRSSCFASLHRFHPQATAWIVPPQHNLESSAFELALRDVQRDWYKVLGHEPFVYTYADLVNHKTMLDRLILFGDALEASRTMSSSSRYKDVARQLRKLHDNNHEGHAIKLITTSDGNNINTRLLCLASVGTSGQTGDQLGAIYALYEFSNSILGIDPQAYWTNHDVVTRLPYLQIPFNTTYSSEKPTFRFRGVFVNDEDVLGGGIARDPMDRSVFDATTWNRYMETILRLKGNLVLPGTCPYMDEVPFELATRRGLYVTQHHIAVLGTNVFEWPKGLPYSFSRNRSVLEQVWRSQVAFTMQRGYRMIYTFGFRGKNDYPFWYDDPEFDTDEKRGKLISQVIALQSQIVDEELAKLDHDIFCEKITYLWAEAKGFYKRGLLTIPPDVHIALSDDSGTGIVDKDTVAMVQPNQGLYYHVMMVHDQYGNQLTEKVSPYRIYSQLRNFVDNNATYMLLINTSDLRDVPLSFAALMEYAWEPNLSLSPAKVQDDLLKKWNKRQYAILDSQTVTLAAEAYSEYFAIPYMNQPSVEGLPVGDQFLILNMRSLAQSLLDDSKNTTEAREMAQTCLDVANTSSVRYTRELANHVRYQILPRIPLNRQVFFRQHLLIQSDIHYHTSAALYLLARAALGAVQEELRHWIKLAHAHATSLHEKLLSDGEASPRWSGWYLYDSCNDLIGAIEHVNLLYHATFDASSAQAYSRVMLAHKFESGTRATSPEFRYEKTRNDFPFFYNQESNNNNGILLGNLVLVLCSSESTMPCTETSTGCSFVSVPGGEARLTLRVLRTRSVHDGLNARIEYSFSGANKQANVNATPFDGSKSVVVEWNKNNTTLLKARLVSGEGHEPLQVETQALLELTKVKELEW